MKTLLYIFVFEYMLHAHLLLILDLFDKTHSIVHQIFPHCMRFMGLKCRFSHSIKDSHTKEVTQPLTGKTGIRLPCVAFLKAYTFKVHFCKKGAKPCLQPKFAKLTNLVQMWFFSSFLIKMDFKWITVSQK